MRKKLKPLPEQRALVHATCLSQLGELKCLFFFVKICPSWEGYTTMGGGMKGLSPFKRSQVFVCRVIDLQSFVRKCTKG